MALGRKMLTDWTHFTDDKSAETVNFDLNQLQNEIGQNLTFCSIFKYQLH